MNSYINLDRSSKKSDRFLWILVKHIFFQSGISRAVTILLFSIVCLGKNIGGTFIHLLNVIRYIFFISRSF